MTSEQFVKSKFPNAFSYGMIDNARRQKSIVIIKGDNGLEIFPNEGATNASRGWTNAKKYLLEKK